MARIATKRNRMAYPMGAPARRLSEGEISGLAAGERAKTGLLETVAGIATAEGIRTMAADHKAQFIGGRAEIDNSSYEFFASLDTNTDEATYEQGYNEFLKIAKDSLSFINNPKAKRDLGLYIQASQPEWYKKLIEKTFDRKRTNVIAKANNLRDSALRLDLSDFDARMEADSRITEGAELLRSVGVSNEEVTPWIEEALQLTENREIFLLAQKIVDEQGYEAAIDFVMNEHIDIDSKRDIVSDIRFDASQKQLEYDSYVEKIEQDFLGKLRQEKLTEDEIMGSNLEVDKKQEWLRLIDAQAKERLSGEVPLNVDAYDKLQTMIEDYDKGRIDKDAVRKALSEAAGKDVSMTIYRSLRDRLAVKDKPDDPMNKASAKRAMSILTEMKTADMFWPEDIESDDPEGKRQNLLKYLDLTKELEQWITANPDATDEQINDKVDTITKPIVEKVVLNWFERLMWTKRQQLFGLIGTQEERLAKKKAKAGIEEEDLSTMTDEELEAIIRRK